MPEFIIQGDVASNGRTSMSVAGGNLFKRNAIKGVGAPGARQVQWLVGEVDGVRCYVQENETGTHIVLTKDDLYP